MPELMVTMDDGAAIHVVTTDGDGPAAVLLHDLDCSLPYWDDVVRRLLQLDADLNIVAVDLRGHGGSTSVEEPSRKRLVKDVKRVCRSLGLEAPVLVGHGWGADVAMACDFAGSVVAINPLMGRGPAAIEGDLERPPHMRGAQSEALLRACTIGATTAKPLRRSKRDVPLALLYADPADVQALAGSDALEQALEAMRFQAGSRHLPLEMPNAIAAILLSWIEEVA